MDEATRESYKEKARVARVLANENRLMIIDALRDGEMSVQSLAEKLQLDQSTISKNLSILKSMGIVRDRRAGNKVYYFLRARCILNFFSCANEVIMTSIEDKTAAL